MVTEGRDLYMKAKYTFIHKSKNIHFYCAKTESEPVFDINTEVLTTTEQFIMVFLKATITKDTSPR